MFSLKTIIRDIFLFLLIGIVISVVFEGDEIAWNADFFKNVAYSSILCFLLAWGNTFIFLALDKKIPWIEKPLQRLLTQVFSHVAYSSLVIGILNFILLYFISSVEYRSEFFIPHLKSNLIVGLIITVFVLLIIQGERFFENWKTSLIKAESLEKEKAVTQYQALRSQVNPHFLFNSLNTLSGLIHQNADLADKYVNKLAEVYRYVLTHQESEVVELNEELEFIRSYLYLLNIRYNGCILYEIQFKDENQQFYIIPLGLQILIENAIKHNRISSKKSFSIIINIEEDFLLVKNEKLPRISPIESTGKGLSNLKKRYEFLTSRRLVIEETQTHFMVQIPLLIYENTDH